MTTIPYLNENVYKTSRNFALGWLAGASVIAAGKAYIVLTSSNATVHGLFGHYGKPSFRRELAVGGATLHLVAEATSVLAQRLSISPTTSKRCGIAVAVPIALLSGMYTSKAVYPYLKTVAICYGVARVLFAIVNYSQGAGN